jgi:branched-chain amino acid transport system substrate-binding protein
MIILRKNYIYFFLALALLVPGCRKKEPPITPSGRTVKVGVIGPMSGPSRDLGQNGLKGIKLSLIMHPYLKNGDKLELVVADDRNDPRQSVKEFKNMMNTQKVSAVLLLSSSASCLAINDIADRYKTPVLVNLGTHPKIATNTKYVSQLCFDDLFQGKVAALFVHDELLIDRVTVFSDPNSFHSSSLADEFVKKFMDTGGEVTDIISLKAGPKADFSKILTKIRKDKPKLLYLPIEPQYIIKIIKALRSIGWFPECMSSDGLLARVVSRYQNEVNLLDGLYAVDFYSSTIIPTPYGKKAIKKYHEVYGKKGNSFAALGVEGMDILRFAMNRCADPEDRECVNDKLRHTINFCGIMGKITIKEDGKARRPLIVNQIRHEKILGVVKVY